LIGGNLKPLGHQSRTKRKKLTFVRVQLSGLATHHDSAPITNAEIPPGHAYRPVAVYSSDKFASLKLAATNMSPSNQCNRLSGRVAGGSH
jgi:hypothetical protein